ncbi:MAG: tyrosine-protein phosphatase [Acidobacteriota bacterium]|jgi:protein tyrosine/serine phosphatase|nr:tyrosine-protein phosphatase [Acidobacteriota bacterium]
MSLKAFRRSFGALVAVVAFAIMASAQSAAHADFTSVKIKNFGQMDDRFYRGAQPKKDDYEALKAIGINTVVDLQAEPKDYEKQAVESLGMRYVNIPMVDKAYPTEAAVTAFMKLVDDPATGKFYVHCAGGRHRTGAMGAVYRFNKYHWDFDQVYAEMKKFDFYTSWGHGDFKTFVQDYYAQTQAKGAASTGGR